jgi:hypothetical protein
MSAARFQAGDRVVPCSYSQAMEVVSVKGTVYRLRDENGRVHVACDGELISEREHPGCRLEEQANV